MTRPTSLFVIALLACSGQGSSAPEKRRVCELLSIAASVSKEVQDHATQQYVSAEHAFEKWEQWQRDKVTPDQDGTGEYSRAGDRANRYRAAGDALCQAAVLSYWQMRELARVFEEPSVQKELRALSNFNCVMATASPIAPKADKRKAFFDDWRARSARAHEAATGAVDECYTKYGGTRPAANVPGTYLPGE